MSAEVKIRILVADDHFIVRSGLAAVIDCEPDMVVVAQAADGAQAVELFERHQPDVALLDLRMPGVGGNEAIEAIRKGRPDARILVLTAYSGDEDIHRALEGRLGATAVLGSPSTAFQFPAHPDDGPFDPLPPGARVLHLGSTLHTAVLRLPRLEWPARPKPKPTVPSSPGTDPA